MTLTSGQMSPIYWCLKRGLKGHRSFMHLNPAFLFCGLKKPVLSTAKSFILWITYTVFKLDRQCCSRKLPGSKYDASANGSQNCISVISSRVNDPLLPPESSSRGFFKVSFLNPVIYGRLGSNSPSEIRELETDWIASWDWPNYESLHSH